MKKKIMIIMMGIMLIGVNVFAQGDLKVTGHSAIGADANTDTGIVLRVAETSTLTTFNGIRSETTWNPSTPAAAGTVALSGQIIAEGTNFTTGAQMYGLQFYALGGAAGSGNSSLNATGLETGIKNIGFAGITLTLGSGYGMRIHTSSATAGGNSSTLTANNLYGAYIYDATATVNNLYGMWIEPMTAGATKNSGIVLAGDGAGADIVFGTGNNVKLYARAGELYVLDSALNETPLGPHDFETGEWIFYSKNLKSGRTVRVNMEKLVKAVEKLTGETFLVEELLEEGQ